MILSHMAIPCLGQTTTFQAPMQSRNSILIKKTSLDPMVSIESVHRTLLISLKRFLCFSSFQNKKSIGDLVILQPPLFLRRTVDVDKESF